ncbi:MAG: sugar-binding protein [bacterium]
MMSILQKIRGIKFKKCLSCMILIWIFSLVVFPNVYSQEKTKNKSWIINSGFEDGADDWTLKEAEVISDEPFSGKNCVIIRGGGYNYALQDIDVIPGKTYYFSCFVRTSSNKDIKWEAVVQEGKKWLTHAFGKKQLEKWTKTNTLTFIPEGNQIRVALWNYNGEGDVYYDDIYLSLEPPEGIPEYQKKSPAQSKKSKAEVYSGNFLKNPSFEKEDFQKQNVAIYWPSYAGGYTRSSKNSFSGKWACQISSTGKDKRPFGCQITASSYGLPSHGTFTVSSSIYIESYEAGQIFNAYVTVIYTDGTQKIFKSLLTHKQIEMCLKKWESYSFNFTTNPDKKIKVIVPWCLVTSYNSRNFEGTVYFDDIMLCQVSPYIAIPKTKTPPVLDGKLNDEAWKHAALISGFTTIMEPRPPVNPTKVYMLYDDNYIYFGSVCYEKILNPALQKRHLFKADIKEHDSNVFSDDSIEIFISPNGNQDSYYQFAYNSNGVYYDAFKMDKSWNTNVKVVAAVGDKAWYAEVRIPISSVKLEKPFFKFNVCRNEKPYREQSSWSPVQNNFHDVSFWGTGSLYAGKVPQIYTDNLQETMSGNSEYLKINISNSNDSSIKSLVSMNIKEAKKQGGESRVVQDKCVIAENAATTIQLKAKPEKPGDYDISYSLMDRNSGQLLYRSPGYLAVYKESIRANLVSDFEGETEIWLNHAKVNGENFNLSYGINILDLKFKRPENSQCGVKGNIEIFKTANIPAQSLPIDDCWRAISNKEESISDSTGNFPVLLPDGSIWSSSAKSSQLTLRRIIIVDNEKFSPIPVDEGLHIAKGTSQHLTMIVKSPINKTLKNITLTIKTPPEIKLIKGGADNINLNMGKLNSVSVETKNENGKTFSYHKFQFNSINPLLDERLKYAYLLPLVFQLSENTAGNSSNVFYRISGESQSRDIIELWNRLPVVCLAQPSSKSPKKLETQIYHTWTGNYNNEQIDALLTTWRQVGFNTYGNQTAIHSFVGGKRDIWLDRALNQGYHVAVDSGGDKLFKKMLPTGIKSINFSGKTIINPSLSPLYLRGKGRTAAVNCVAEFFKWTRATHLMWDLEFTPTIHCDTSPSALIEFAKYADLSEVPKKEEVLSKYKDKWIDYQCWVWAQVGKIFRDGVKKADPNGKLVIYSGYQSKGGKDHNGVDWNYHRGIPDMAAAGYGRPSKHSMSETLKAIKDIPLTGGILYYDGYSPPEKYRNLKCSILRRITDGCKGFLIFTWQLLEGRAYQKIDEACSILADFEGFFLENSPYNDYEIKGDLSKDDVVILKNANQYLLLIFNESNRVKKGEIMFPDNLAKLPIRNYPENKAIGKASSLPVSVKPYDASIFLLGKR